MCKIIIITRSRHLGQILTRPDVSHCMPQKKRSNRHTAPSIGRQSSTRQCPSILYLKHSSATINHKIGPIHITPRPTRKQHANPIQLPHSPHTSHRIPARPALPHLLQPLPSIQNRIHVPWRDRIDPDAFARPLGGEGGLERYDGGFGDVVGCLRLRVVDAVRADGGCEGYAAVWGGG